MYVGSIVEENRDSLYATMAEDGTLTTEMRTVTMVPALLKIFDEAATNPLDAALKGQGVRNIKFTVTEDKIVVWNDGDGMPCTLHSTLGVPVPQARRNANKRAGGLRPPCAHPLLAEGLGNGLRP